MGRRRGANAANGKALESVSYKVELEAADPGFVRSGFERQRSAWRLKELPLTSEQPMDGLRQ